MMKRIVIVAVFLMLGSFAFESEAGFRSRLMRVRSCQVQPPGVVGPVGVDRFCMVDFNGVWDTWHVGESAQRRLNKLKPGSFIEPCTDNGFVVRWAKAGKDQLQRNITPVDLMTCQPMSNEANSRSRSLLDDSVKCDSCCPDGVTEMAMRNGCQILIECPDRN